MRKPTLIFVVDDEPNVRLVFRTALTSVGYEVDEACDGEEALGRLAKSSPDVVLLDLLMPGIGGMEVLRRIREAGNDVPVVIVTAHGTIPDAVQAMKLGAIDFLTKPLGLDSLRRVVGEIVVRHSATLDEFGPERSHRPTTVVIAPAAVDLLPVKLALNHRQFDHAEMLLEQALDLDPKSAEAHTLHGVLQECRGQEHAAYHSYRSALESDPSFEPALQNLKRYCEHYHLDFANPAINPSARP